MGFEWVGGGLGEVGLFRNLGERGGVRDWEVWKLELGNFLDRRI